MTTLPPIKRGDTFQLGCLYRSASGTPESVAGFGVRSQARKAASGRLLVELVVEKVDQVTNPGEFCISAIDTTDWPIGELLIDIEFRAGLAVVSSETMRLTVLEDVTHD